MAAPPSSPCYPSTTTTSSDNDKQEQQYHHHQQQQSCFSSLESFLFLPQLPVNGDDDNDDGENEDTNFSYHHHYLRQCKNNMHQPQPQQQSTLLAVAATAATEKSLLSTKPTTAKSSSNAFLSTDYENDDVGHKNPCQRYGAQQQSHSSSSTKRSSNDSCSRIPPIYENSNNCSSSINDFNSSDHVCGDASTTSTLSYNSLFPFIAANDTVIGSTTPSSKNSPSNNIKEKRSLKKSSAEINFKPALLALTTAQRQEEDEVEDQQEKPFSSSSMTILIRNSNSTNRSHNYNNSPFCFAANHQRQRERSHLHRHSHQNRDHHQCNRRRLLIFRICQAFSIIVGVVFLLSIVRNSILAMDDDYDEDIRRLDSFNPSLPFSSSSSSSSLASSRLQQHRLIQRWNMPSIISSPSSASASSSSFSSFTTNNNTTFKIPEMLSDLSSSGSNSNSHHNLFLLDLPNFKFLMNNKTKCNIHRDDDNYNDGGSGGGGDDGATNNNDTIFFMIIISSAPQNFEARQAIRETYGSVKRLGQFHVRLVFLLGKTFPSAAAAAADYDKKKNEIKNDNYIAEAKVENIKKKFYNSKEDEKIRFSSLDSKIQEESLEYGDIVTGNFHDSYRNLTYKHLMGYLWVLHHCNQAKFIIKADDDAFIDIFQLFEFVLRTFGENPEAALICNVFPEGSKPVRTTDTRGRKWAVTYSEYPYETYPKYCGGLAYLATPDVIHEIYRMSQRLHNTYFWIDDVYVTGILRKLAQVEPFYLNLRYSYDPEEYRKWLRVTTRPAAKNNNNHEDVVDLRKEAIAKGKEEEEEGVATAADSSNEMNYERRQQRQLTLAAPPQKIPFMIVHLERGMKLGREMRELWNKTRNVWSESGLIL